VSCAAETSCEANRAIINLDAALPTASIDTTAVTLDGSNGAAIALPNTQIPIAFATAAKYAAVSSIGACATPAREGRISAHAGA